MSSCGSGNGFIETRTHTNPGNTCQCRHRSGKCPESPHPKTPHPEECAHQTKPETDDENVIILNNKKWYVEMNSQWPGQAFMLRYTEMLLHVKSPYQDIKVLQTDTWGKALVLDGVVQMTERDEFAYQEMISHLPLFLHAEPKRVLVVGGGDGLVAREVCRHEGVEGIVLCEIDSEVVSACKRFLPSGEWGDPRLEVQIGDASEFVREEGCRGRFDVVICDSSDPVGPAEALFSEEFYGNLSRCLTPGGVVCFQSESIWLELDFVAGLREKAMRHFKVARYASVQTPTYPCGQIGLMVCSNSARPPASRPCPFAGDLRCYSDEVARAAFVLPAFAARRLQADSLAFE